MHLFNTQDTLGISAHYKKDRSLSQDDIDAFFGYF